MQTCSQSSCLPSTVRRCFPQFSDRLPAFCLTMPWVGRYRHEETLLQYCNGNLVIHSEHGNIQYCYNLANFAEKHVWRCDLASSPIISYHLSLSSA